jgi:tetratricopeptide (TPR) repeat protein
MPIDKLMNTKLKSVIILLVLLCLLALPAVINAQDLRHDGITEPYHPSYVRYRVGLYYMLGENYERALDEFTEAIDGLPQFGSAYAARGDVYLVLGEYELALADYTAAIDIYPDFVSALYMRGRAHHALDEIELASADYENAIRQMPEYALPYWGMGDLYYEQAHYEDALENYQMYLALAVDTPDADVLVRILELELVTVADAL